jgi:ketosteroid isomerase-like protein
MPSSEDDRDDVLAANRAFYRAFAARDLAGMTALWASSAPVSCIHPGWPEPLKGRARVLTVWSEILSGPGNPDIRCKAEDVALHGDAAVVLCEEHLDAGILLATNVFVREDGIWRMTHHQSGPTQRAVERRSPPAPTAANDGAPPKNRMH